MSDDKFDEKKGKLARGAALVPVPAVLMGLGMLYSPASAALVAVDDHYSTPQNVTLTGVNVFANDELTNATPAITLYSQPEHGSASITANGVLTYTPNTGFAGQDRMFYSANDGIQASNADIFIDVSAAVPALSPLALGGLAALVAWFGLRRKPD